MMNLTISKTANGETTNAWTRNHIPQLVMKLFLFITKIFVIKGFLHT